MKKIVDYYYQDNKGMFVKLKNGKKYHFVYLGFEDDERMNLGIVINNHLYDKNNNADIFWWLLEKLWNYDTSRYMKYKIEEYFTKNGFETIKQEVTE